MTHTPLNRHITDNEAAFELDIRATDVTVGSTRSLAGIVRTDTWSCASCPTG